MSEQQRNKEEDEKLLNFMRHCRSQPMPPGQFRVSTPIHQQEMRPNVTEIIHLPTSNQPLNSPSAWSELHQTVARIRNSPSSFRVLVQSSTGHSYVSIVDPNSSTTDQNHQDPNSQANSTSSWPV